MDAIEISGAVSGLGGEPNCRVQSCGFELTGAVGVLDHGPLGRVAVFHDNDPGIGTKMQYPQHVAGREGCDEKFLGVVTSAIAAKCRVSAAGQSGRFSFGCNLVVAGVIAVT